MAVKRALLLLLLVSGCLPGPELVRERYNATLLIVGTTPGEQLEVHIGDEVARPRARAGGADDGVITVLLSLEPGSHDGEVRAQRAQLPARCAGFTIVIDEEPSSAATVDMAMAPRCDATPDPLEEDAGVPAPEEDGGSPLDGGPVDPPETLTLVSFTEELVVPGQCAGGFCTETFTISSDGDAALSLPDGEEQATADDSEVDSLATVVLSPAVNVLFAEGCVTEAGGLQVTYARDVVRAQGRVALVETETFDASGCDDDAVGQLRATSAQLRSELFNP